MYKGGRSMCESVNNSSLNFKSIVNFSLHDVLLVLAKKNLTIIFYFLEPLFFGSVNRPLMFNVMFFFSWVHFDI